LSKSSRPTLAISAPDKDGVFRNAQVYGIEQCPQAVFTRLDGALYFGSVEAIERAFNRIERKNPAQKHMVLVLKGVGDIDMPGGMCIVEEARKRRRRGGGLKLDGPPCATCTKRIFMECALRPGGSGEMVQRPPAKTKLDDDLHEPASVEG